jgi:hypothetical protein
MDGWVQPGEERTYEAASEVDAEGTTVLAQVDLLEEWEWIHADTARVIV